MNQRKYKQTKKMTLITEWWVTFTECEKMKSVVSKENMKHNTINDGMF